jgi:Rhodanese-like domain
MLKIIPDGLMNIRDANGPIIYSKKGKGENMNRSRFYLSIGLGLAVAALLALGGPAGAAENGKSLWGPNCLNCHKYDPSAKLIMGDFQSYSRQANLLTVKIGPKPLLVKVTEQTKLENAASYRDLTGDNALKITFEEKPDGYYAQKVTVKPKLKVPDNQLMSTQEMEKLVAQGPEAGKFVLLDSRPAYRFQEERIPGALNMPLPNFDKLTNLLPQDKAKMVIFYCQGST